MKLWKALCAPRKFRNFRTLVLEYWKLADLIQHPSLDTQKRPRAATKKRHKELDKEIETLEPQCAQLAGDLHINQLFQDREGNPEMSVFFSARHCSPASRTPAGHRLDYIVKDAHAIRTAELKSLPEDIIRAPCSFLHLTGLSQKSQDMLGLAFWALPLLLLAKWLGLADFLIQLIKASPK